MNCVLTIFPSSAEVAQPPDIQVPAEIVEIKTYTPPQTSPDEAAKVRFVGFAGYTSKDGMLQPVVPIWLVLQGLSWSEPVGRGKHWRHGRHGRHRHRHRHPHPRL